VLWAAGHDFARWYAANVSISFLLALLDARPSGPAWDHAWLSDMLGEHLLRRVAANVGAPLSLRGWSVGSVVGNETFVQARPIVRDPEVEPVEDLLRTPAPCILAAFNAAPGGDRLGETHTPIRLARFRRWIGVRAEAELDADTRRRLRDEVPDFLGRSQTLGNDGELVFQRFLAALHAAGALGSAYAPPEVVRRALRTTEALLGDGPVNLMVSDGRTLGVVHRGGTLLLFQPPTVGSTRRALKIEDEARASPRGSLLWFDPGPPAEAPSPKAERIAEGVFTIESLRPRQIGRAPA